MLEGSWSPDAVLLGARGSPPSVAPPRPAACGLPAGRHQPGRLEGGTGRPERRRRPPPSVAPPRTAACGLLVGRRLPGRPKPEGRDRPTGEAETAGDRECRRKDWGWGLGATERGLRTLGWGQRETARGGDDRRRTRIVGRIWFFFFVAL
jgi:hypothetical protein